MFPKCHKTLNMDLSLSLGHDPCDSASAACCARNILKQAWHTRTGLMMRRQRILSNIDCIYKINTTTIIQLTIIHVFEWSKMTRVYFRSFFKFVKVYRWTLFKCYSGTNLEQNTFHNYDSDASENENRMAQEWHFSKPSSFIQWSATTRPGWSVTVQLYTRPLSSPTNTGRWYL